MQKASRYWHTLRHLKAEQIAFQVLHRGRKLKPRTGPVPLQRAQSDKWVAPIAGTASFDPPGRFTFFNEVGDLADIGWDGPQRSLLWRYNQHYFADLVAADASERNDAQVALIKDWITANPPGRGVGWHAYPTSLRIIAWIKWALAGNTLPAAAAASLADQARWLSRNLERHILGNHLFVNAKALIFSGLWFEGDEADRWRTIGLRVLAREFPEQILPDGGHFELSPMYHILALEDVLDLINITQCFDSGLEALTDWRDRVPEMLRWMAAMRHPDGEIAFFNDAAIGIAPTPTIVADYAARLGLGGMPEMVPGLLRLEVSGYVRATLGPAILLADMAAVGPDYLPGHAHADTLSFELSLQGRRLIVNSGTSVYGTGPERLRQRGTAAHATVVVDGVDSSEVWGGFRVARRARIRNVQFAEEESYLCFEASHDGYTRLSGAPLHHRRWQLGAAGLQITDRIEGRGDHDIEVGFPLAPGWTPDVQPDGACRIHGPEGMQVNLTVSSGRIEARRFSYHSRFGIDETTWRIVVLIAGPLPVEIKTQMLWEALCGS